MSNHVTYLFGAGASCNALPMLNQMQSRMTLYYNFLSNPELALHDFHDSISEYEIILKDFKEVLDQAGRHATIDTYAKKLFLKDRRDLRKMNALKFFLGGFFVFEQMGFNSSELIQNPECVYEGFKPFDKNSDPLSIKVDPRYDVFFATLLDNTDGIKLPPNVNIVSWNYDYQFELAFKEYIDHSDALNIAQQNLNLFYSKEEDHSKVIKLNGSAANFYAYEGFKGVQSVRKELSRGEYSEYFKYLFKQYKNVCAWECGDYLVPNINFAWELESNEQSRTTVRIAQEIMDKTNTLVIIGYSFPNFNREIDKRLLNSFKGGGKKIYYQAPEKDVHGLITRLKGLLPNYVGEPIPHTELDQFFIPYEL